MKKCKNCGNELEPTDRFCGLCGNKIESESLQQQEVPGQQSYQQPYQQPIQQPIQQGFYQQSNNGTPILKINKPSLSKVFALLSWDGVYGRMHITVNGIAVTPPDGVKFCEEYSVEIPISSNFNVIEGWITNPFFKGKNKFLNAVNVHEINLDPSQSYIFKIDDMFKYSFLKKFGFSLLDINGNIVFKK